MTDGGLFLLVIIFISKTSLCLGNDYYYGYNYELDDSYDYNYDEFGYDNDVESPKEKGMENSQTVESCRNVQKCILQ